MQRVLTAVVLIPLVLLAVFKAPFWLYALLIAAIAMLCVHEYLRICTAHNLKPLRALTYAGVAVVIAHYYLSIIVRGARPPTNAAGWALLSNPFFQYEIMLILVSATPFVMLIASMTIDDLRQALPSAAVSYIAVPYFAITLGFLLFIRALLIDGAFAILYLLLVVWSGDVFAYYVGRAIGRTPLAPRISPKKSWEGTLASIIGSMIVGTLILVYNAPIAAWLYRWKLLSGGSVLAGQPVPAHNPIWSAILVSVSINLAAQLGDLVESMMKRGADLKDSGALLPGHGGVLDRVDALLLASPVLWYYGSFGTIHF